MHIKTENVSSPEGRTENLIQREKPCFAFYSSIRF